MLCFWAKATGLIDIAVTREFICILYKDRYVKGHNILK